jgi:hypothetical protein
MYYSFQSYYNKGYNCIVLHSPSFIQFWNNDPIKPITSRDTIEMPAALAGGCKVIFKMALAQ